MDHNFSPSAAKKVVIIHCHVSRILQVSSKFLPITTVKTKKAMRSSNKEGNTQFKQRKQYVVQATKAIRSSNKESNTQFICSSKRRKTSTVKRGNNLHCKCAKLSNTAQAITCYILLHLLLVHQRWYLFSPLIYIFTSKESRAEFSNRLQQLEPFVAVTDCWRT